VPSTFPALQGYNSWYDVQMSPSQEQMLASGNALVKTGLSALGYSYLNVDDGWSLGRFPNGTIRPDPKFPAIGSLSSALQGLGLALGLYGDRGTQTCGGRTGQQGYEQLDADTLVNDFKISYWKEDSCFSSTDHATAYLQYAKMRDALAANGNTAGRPVFFSLCGWNAWYSAIGAALGNSFRIGPDDTNWEGVLVDIDDMAPLWNNAGPGGWNDACLLLGRDSTGTLAVTEPQSRAQFSMWAVLANPLLLSQDVRNLSALQLETYSNAEVIAVNQDRKGRQGQRWAGGSLSLNYMHAGAGVDGVIPVTLQPCGVGADGNPPTSQQWAFNVTALGFLTNAGTQMCMNVDDCGSSLIAYSCVTEGGTCCGADCYDNEIFSFDASSGLLRSAIGSDQCVTSNGLLNAAALQQCEGTPAQQWTYNSSTQSIADAATGKTCLTVGGGFGNRTNVWGRPLLDGSFAVVFLNADVSSLDVVCDYVSCLSNSGWEPEVLMQVRDLWSHEDLGVHPVGSGWNVSSLDADGGVAMFKFTPYWNTTQLAAGGEKSHGSSVPAAAKGQRRYPPAAALHTDRNGGILTNLQVAEVRHRRLFAATRYEGAAEALAAGMSFEGVLKMRAVHVGRAAPAEPRPILV